MQEIPVACSFHFLTLNTNIDKPTANSYILQVTSNILIPMLSLCQCRGEKLIMIITVKQHHMTGSDVALNLKSERLRYHNPANIQYNSTL